jgi:O-antigen ligase
MPKRKNKPAPFLETQTAPGGLNSLRRVLLALVMMLIVARPLILGEDPGFSSHLSTGSSLVLTLLWLVTAFSCSLWQLLSREAGGRRHVLVSAGLAVTAGIIFVGAFFGAAYKHPTYLVAWEWVAFLLAFWTSARLADHPEERGRLLAGLTAMVVALSAQAAYQHFVEIPETRRLLDDPALLRERLSATLGQYVEADDPILLSWQNRIEMNHVYATFAHPNSFASYLALLLPATLAYALAGFRQTLPLWRKGLIAGFALLVLAALWWTHSRGAILGTLLVGCLFLVRAWAGLGWKRLTPVIVGSLAIIGLLIAVAQTKEGRAGLRKATESFELRRDYWIATWSMIRDHFWLGVGPGNFGEHYPQYMLPTAFEDIKDPHNFVLEVWATSGVAAVLALGVTLGALFWLGLKGRDKDQDDVEDERRPLRLEYYIGGMVGFILAFLLQSGSASRDEIVKDAILAVGRSIVWFGAFALFESVMLTSRSMRLAILAGVAAMLLNLCVSGGIASPTVAQPMWIMAGLALAVAGEKKDIRHSAHREQREKQPPRRFLSVTAVAILLLAITYLFTTYYPVTACLADMSRARAAYGNQGQEPGWYNSILPRLENIQSAPASPAAEQEVRAANSFLRTRLLEPLEQAVKEDPGNASAFVELAVWYGQQWQLFPSDELAKKALARAARAQELDPIGKQGYLAEYRLRMVFASVKGREAEQYAAGMRALGVATSLDPGNAQLRLEYAGLAHLAGQDDEAKQAANVAAELDAGATHAERKLTPKQRERLKALFP